ncbi:hypothetical protein BEL04_09525 [Mucilaginibacter sp. PPCGB 2223]|uniref:hypothetical protein n=1 Tax=Mucilaginibacter sp. PPCGB 2223 TaxID=1886027 RepID=UPI000824B505|nr:hypothetical protein [Mucilaginibacter sp. PPCGB 2223]OCX54468.1 hypothetical protein BEL04_09525 [Mucilaginibacter sp. PPCGB 2223]
MSEEKVIQHTKKAVHIIKDKKRPLKEKLKDIALEVAIIIFAVSVTLVLHNWNDARHEHHIEREFLEGVKEDLKLEADKLETSNRDFQPVVDFYNTAWHQIKTNKIDGAYFDRNSTQLTNTAYYVADNGRFEGFKSSGYLRLIRNQQLLKDLMTLYTIDIPFQEQIDKNLFAQRSADYDKYVGIKGVADSTGTHISRLLNDPAVRYLISRYVTSFNERKQQQLALAKQIRDVVAEIDKELNK